MLFFADWAGACSFFLLFGRGRGPRPSSKQKHDPAQTEKINTPPPLPSVLFFAVWADGRVYFFAVWAGDVFFFAVWAGGVFFLLFGPGACFFFLFGRWACSFFLLFGRGACLFFCCLGGGREFTHLPICLARL